MQIRLFSPNPGCDEYAVKMHFSVFRHLDWAELTTLCNSFSSFSSSTHKCTEWENLYLCGSRRFSFGCVILIALTLFSILIPCMISPSLSAYVHSILFKWTSPSSTTFDIIAATAAEAYLLRPFE